LENILVARCFTHEQQQNLLGEVVGAVSEDRFSLLIVDSVTSLFRVDFSGRGMLSERQQKLGKHLNTLMKVSEEFNLAVIVTNQVMSDPSGAMMFVQDSKKPIGGHVVAHASTTRLYLKKGRAEQRVCKIYDSPSLPEADCIYQITDQGINDATD
jgi:meiotic recombination protein DMC1